jgi:hypothetical protein
MYRESKTTHQLNVFTNTYSHFRGQSLKIYINDKEWHNQFRTNIKEKIDEEPFRPLYSDNVGAPNASIAILICMIILKEAHGLSDSQLFEYCRFHALFRSALGLFNDDDPVPAESTYYLFRKKMYEWEKAGNGNLLEQVFAQITKSQIKEFSINGNKIRMDSKLIGSNIAKLSRYEVVHETVRIACLSVNESFDSFLTVPELKVLAEVTSETCSSVIYRCTSSQIESKLLQLGIIILKVLNHFGNNLTEQMEVLRKVFYQQFEVVNHEVIILPQERLEPGRIDSPHDPESRFWKKGEDKLSGYISNITETCNPDNPVNLITNVAVEPASAPDNSFLIPAVEETQELFPEKIETLNTDGGYHSEPNHTFCSEKDLDFVISAIGSVPSRLEHSVDEDGNLTCIDTQTGELLETKKVVPKKENTPRKWKVYCPWLKKPRIITQHDVDIGQLRKQIAARSKEELNLRANIEATIFQFGYHYRANKTRYRGLIKHRMWAFVRCIWINFVRIMNYTTKIVPTCENVRQNWISEMEKNVLFLVKSCFFAIFSVFWIFWRFNHLENPNFAE